MGHGASVSQMYREEETVFVSRDLLEGCKRLGDDPSLRNAFLSYVRSGEWLNIVSRSNTQDPIQKIRGQGSSSSSKSHMQDYGASTSTHAKLCALESPTANDVSTTDYDIPTARTSSSLLDALLDAGSGQLGSGCPNGSLSCLDRQELMSVVLSIALPLFQSSQDLHQKNQHDRREDDDASTVTGDISPTSQISSSSRRAQDCLLSCAANCQESELAKHMSSPRWLDFVGSAFDNYHLPISVIDTTQAHPPFLFVNKAFLHLFGGTRSWYVGESFDTLNGPATEENLSAEVQEALRTNASRKVAITHYTEGRKKFLDFLALRASGGYTFAVHCFGGSPTLIEDLKMVDDVLLLMCCVVHTPPVTRWTRAQSWIPNLRNMCGANRHPIVVDAE